MLFRRFIKGNPNHKLSEKIKHDLISTLRSKGISVRDIKVDLDFDDMNMKVFILDRLFQV